MNRLKFLKSLGLGFLTAPLVKDTVANVKPKPENMIPMPIGKPSDFKNLAFSGTYTVTGICFPHEKNFILKK